MEPLKVPSGYLTVRHGKSPFLIGKPSINGPFSMAMLNNQRVDDLLVEVFLHSCVKLTNLTEGISYMSNKDLIKVPDLKMI
jgi:hypothetical protein